MKKTKNIFSIGLAILLTLCMSISLVGCQEIYNHKPKTYGEWDGNYIYSANYRSKTTGEDCEKLVSEVVYEGITYQIEDDSYYYINKDDSRYSYFIHGDYIYLVLIGTKDKTLSSKKFLIRYNLKEKTQETVFAKTHSNTEESFEYISYVSDERIVLEKGDSWFALDFNGNLIEENFPCLPDATLLGNEYLIYYNYKDKTLVYRTFADPTERKIMDADSSSLYYNCRYEFIETENQTGIAILDIKNSRENIVNNIWFFNLETGTLHTTAENINQRIFWVKNYPYFLSYEWGWVSYMAKSNSCFGVEEQTFETTLNYKMYAVDCANGSMREVYVFEPNRCCDQVNILRDGNIYVTQMWWEDYQFLKNAGGKVSIRSRFDFDSETFTIVSEEEYDRIYDLRRQSEKVVCGEYVYYMKGYFEILLYGKSEAMELIRIKGEQMESMQFCTTFGEEKDLEKGVKGCRKILRPSGYLNIFIVLPY